MAGRAQVEAAELLIALAQVNPNVWKCTVNRTALAQPRRAPSSSAILINRLPKPRSRRLSGRKEPHRSPADQAADDLATIGVAGEDGERPLVIVRPARRPAASPGRDSAPGSCFVDTPGEIDPADFGTGVVG
jgi:hypothetical protein